MFESVKRLGEIFIAPVYLSYTVLSGAYDAYKWIRGSKPASPHGDASFMTERELRKFSKPTGLMPGVSQRGRRIRLGDEASMLMFGMRGAGKTQTANANIKALNDARVKPDLLIADDHGDIEIACRSDLEAMGYQVIRIDLSDPLNSFTFDPFRYPNPNNEFEYEREIQRLAMLLMPESGKENDAGEHFLENARAVLEGSIVYEMEKDKRSIRGVCEFLLTDKKRRTEVFGKMRSHRNLLVKAAVDAFEAAGDRERGSMDTTLSRKLRPWLSNTLGHITTTDRGLNFDEMFLDPRPHAVFIRTGGADREHSGSFIRLVMGVAIFTVKRLWNVTKKPLPKGLLLIVDEPETVGNCSAFVVALKELRKVGVNLFICFQSYAALKETYRDYAAIWSNCTKVIAGGSGDIELFKQASLLAGDRTIHSKSWGTNGESQHEAGKPLLRPDEIQTLPADEVVVIGPGILAKLKKPFQIRRHGVRYL
ncbi:TraG/TraD family protein [Bradyrhizobiaceae bacterium SG-6C]|nr:TraG/TraD family protein [Bradyrhizobiaceae bacterium SG-6C]